MADVADPFAPVELSRLGAYRVRAHARGRDHKVDGVDLEPVEEYFLIAWPAPPGPAVIHKQSDRFGCRQEDVSGVSCR